MSTFTLPPHLLPVLRQALVCLVEDWDEGLHEFNASVTGVERTHAVEALAHVEGLIAFKELHEVQPRG